MTQAEAQDILRLGYNVFLTGAAGSGKTYVLNEFIQHLKKNKIEAGVTASTGIAATHINGMTIHSWSGMGIRDEIDEAGLKSLSEKGPLVKRMEKTKVLIIDEVSMLHGKRLSLVDSVCRQLKDPSKPFGGLQVILCGDLFQLPPVTRSGEVDWVHLSDTWKSMDLKVCYLTEQHRQEDNDLLSILNAIRNGEIEEYHQTLLSDRLNASVPAEISKHTTKLYTHNVDVDQMNESQLGSLDTDSREYYMGEVKGSKKLLESLKASCLAPEVLTLKIGAEVMFVANNQADGYANGTRGKVVAFTDEDLPVVVTTDEKTIVPGLFSWRIMDGDTTRAEVSQIPLRLAWAITIHKSQGMTLDEAIIDLSRAFEPGMGYVAISRVRSLDGLHLTGANSNALAVHPDIRELDAVLRNRSEQLSRAFKNLDKEKKEANQKKVLAALATEDVDNLEYEEELYNALRRWRMKQSKVQSVPAYMVLSDATVKYIASRKPKNKKELSKIKGIGPQKLDRYSKDILAELKRYKKPKPS